MHWVQVHRLLLHCATMLLSLLVVSIPRQATAFSRFRTIAPQQQLVTAMRKNNIVRYMAKKKRSKDGFAAIRPSLDDIERISRGQAAKKRGVGSRAVPHRLNAAERKEWDLAKKRRFLQLRGTGWRKERGDSPLANIYRNYCDAAAVPCISIERSLGQTTISGLDSLTTTSILDSTSSGSSGGGDDDLADDSEQGNEPIGNVDYVTIDFSPLRRLDVSELAAQCIAEARAHYPDSCVSINDYSDYSVQGWSGLEEMFEKDAIWRIPSCAVVLGFNVRADSKRFAERIAVQLAAGQPMSSSSSGRGGSSGGGGGDGGDVTAGAVSSGDEPFRSERISGDDEDGDSGEDELEEVEDEDEDEEDDVLDVHTASAIEEVADGVVMHSSSRSVSIGPK